VVASFLYLSSRHNNFRVDGLFPCARVHVRLCYLRKGQVAEADGHDVRTNHRFSELCVFRLYGISTVFES
jgi:hypothetical protein